MDSQLLEKLTRINARMAELLHMARNFMHGQGDFGPEQVRLIREPLDEMHPLVEDSADLRCEQPEIAEQFDLYKSQVRESLVVTRRGHAILLRRRSDLGAHRAQVDAVSQWTNALSSTR